MGKDLLFEIGVEEIPPKQSPILALQLADLAASALDKERLQYTEINHFHTPRRLVLHVIELDESQEEITEEVRGPAKKTAFDEDGNPTKAALGFCKGHGVDIADTYTQEIDGGEYVFAKKTIPGRETIEILAEILPNMVEALAPAETMRWDDSGFKFIRPIRWFCALFDETPVKFSLGQLNSGNSSRGHRFLGEKSFDVSSAPKYFASLQEHGVVLQASDRTILINEALQRIAIEVGAEPSFPTSLLLEITNNLEHPAPVLGEVPESYLALPREILETTIIEHQKFVPFVIGDKPSKYFVGFRDGSDGSDALVKQGYERVVKARLADSEFFFESDQKTPLSDRVESLKRVVFQEKLGTIWDKMERMRLIGSKVGKVLNFSHLDEIDRTILLCKSDLLTLMVGEFAELQGIVGGIYANLEGEPELVSKGIYEHYLPESPDDPTPQSETGIVASLADKFDSVAGSLLMGEVVTGSRDPFGIRRKANGIIRIALEHKLDIDFFELLDELAELYEFPDEDIRLSVVKEFFLGRLQADLRDSRNVAYDIVDAVVASQSGNFYRIHLRALALDQIRTEDRFQSLVTAFSRAQSITKKQQNSGDFDANLFTNEIEHSLSRACLLAQEQIEKLSVDGKFEEIIEQLISLREPIDQYFEEVHVMDEDEKVRANRLAFLTKLVELFHGLGDLEKIVVEGTDL